MIANFALTKLSIRKDNRWNKNLVDDERNKFIKP